jgi:hypothetical protein
MEARFEPVETFFTALFPNRFKGDDLDVLGVEEPEEVTEEVELSDTGAPDRLFVFLFIRYGEPLPLLCFIQGQQDVQPRPVFSKHEPATPALEREGLGVAPIPPPATERSIRLVHTISPQPP